MQRTAQLLLLVMVAVIASVVTASALAQPNVAIDLDSTVSGVIPTEEIEHAYVLDLPAGVPAVTIAVTAFGDDADMAVYYGPGEEELYYDISTDPYPRFTMDAPRPGRYRIVVLNLLWQPLRYELRVSTAGAPPAAASATSRPGADVPALNVPNRVVAPGEKLRIDFSGAPGNDRDWVGLFREGSADREYLTYAYVRGRRSGDLTFEAPRELGRYEFRLFENDGYGRLAASAAFEVWEAGQLPPAGPDAGAALRVATRLAAPGETIGVRFDGAPGNARDWVGLYREGAVDRQFVNYQYTQGLRSGDLSFELPSEPGRYEFRLFENDGYGRLAVSGVVDVGAAATPAGPIVSAVAIACEGRANQSPLAEREGGAGLAVACPAGCDVRGPLWGTDVYTHDSAVCLAARHAGIIGAQGGSFVITMAPGQSSYEASTRNGVTSARWGAWGRSFTVSAAVPAAAPPVVPTTDVLAGTWQLNANGHAGLLEFDVAGAGWRGTFTLSGRQEELADISYDGVTLRFTRPLGTATQEYVGELAHEGATLRVYGSFSQGAARTVYPWSAERPR